MSVGDRIRYGGEEGILCHQRPCVMRSVAFRSYVPVLGPFETVRPADEEGASAVEPVPEDVMGRIRVYLSTVASTPTGGRQQTVEPSLPNE